MVTGEAHGEPSTRECRRTSFYELAPGADVPVLQVLARERVWASRLLVLLASAMACLDPPVPQPAVRVVVDVCDLPIPPWLRCAECWAATGLADLSQGHTQAVSLMEGSISVFERSISGCWRAGR